MVSWKDWNPGLSNQEQTLKQAHASLPGNDPEAINFIVRLFENPKSPIAFKGAISLERHDCVHILLGRGLLPQDEAFVIGYTMGTSKSLSTIEAGVFKLITKHLYPEPYKFCSDDLVAYNLGLEYGHLCRRPKIYDFPFEDRMNSTLAEIREEFGIDIEQLRKIYACEQVLIPGSTCSKRLPVT